MTTSIEVRRVEPSDRSWMIDVLTHSWGSTRTVTPSGAHDALELLGFVATRGGERVGLVTYANDPHGGCEVVTLNSCLPGRGVGSALLDAVRAAAIVLRCTRLWLATTNDNTSALRFYQRRGWDLVKFHRDAVAEWRRIKPEISLIGQDGIPLRHALELELKL